MKQIPEWQYPLYKESDKTVYEFLVKIGKRGNYPTLIASEEEINAFLKLLILSQKMKDYRKFRDLFITELKKKEVNLAKILNESKNMKISRGIDKSWAVFHQDKRLSALMDNFQDTKFKFAGRNNEICEFGARFLLSQLLQDWRGPLMAVILECLEHKQMAISKLNNLLSTWDYTLVFGKRRGIQMVHK